MLLRGHFEEVGVLRHDDPVVLQSVRRDRGRIVDPRFEFVDHVDRIVPCSFDVPSDLLVRVFVEQETHVASLFDVIRGQTAFTMLLDSILAVLADPRHLARVFVEVRERPVDGGDVQIVAVGDRGRLQTTLLDEVANL